jgi:flagellin
MAAVINTNMASLQAQNQLSRTTASLNNTIQQLSSGLRVNSAADDASGYAISKNMDSVIKGSTVAIRNANDGISFSQTATGAMEEMSNALARMRELAVQSASNSNGITNSALLDTEYQALNSELTRLRLSTSFNGVSVFSSTALSFQISSATTNNTISLSANPLTTTQSVASTLIQGSSATVPGVEIVNAFENEVARTGSTIASVLTITVDAVNASSLSAANKAIAINQLADIYTGNVTNSGTVQNIATDFRKVLGTVDASGTIYTAATATTGSTTIAAGTGTWTLARVTDIGTAATTTATANSTAAITALDAAITEMNTAAATNGAFQNRMAITISNLSTLIETTSAARSRIMDTDFAAQTAQLSKYQILQQAGTAMLAQANQMGSNVLTLLK